MFDKLRNGHHKDQHRVGHHKSKVMFGYPPLIERNTDLSTNSSGWSGAVGGIQETEMELGGQMEDAPSVASWPLAEDTGMPD